LFIWGHKAAIDVNESFGGYGKEQIEKQIITSEDDLEDKLADRGTDDSLERSAMSVTCQAGHQNLSVD
jgi:hypothetical protein